MAQQENVLHLIPGEIIAVGDDSFPPPETCKGEFREIEVDVLGRFRAKIRFEPFYYKRGKMSRLVLARTQVQSVWTERNPDLP